MDLARSSIFWGFSDKQEKHANSAADSEDDEYSSEEVSVFPYCFKNSMTDIISDVLQNLPLKY